jgi:DNA-binding NtrC family response regulator
VDWLIKETKDLRILAATNQDLLAQVKEVNFRIDLLHDCNSNKTEVGREVGLSRTAIWEYMKKWDSPLKKDINQ